MFDREPFTRTFIRTCLRGFRRMPPETQACLAESVSGAQGPGGLFCDRSGREDLYYTLFGLLLAFASGAKIRRKDCAQKTASTDFATLDLVHACARLWSEDLLEALAIPRFPGWRTLVALSRFRNAKNRQERQSLAVLPREAFPQQDPGTPYSRFLLAVADPDFAEASPPAELEAYRLPGGLFANLKDHPNYGLNATAAALFLLPETEGGESADALLSLQESDGSYKAAAAAPSGDLLSTATAIFALKRFGRTPGFPVKPFLRACFRDDAFFAATPDDSRGDLEYTVYGLLAMGVIP